MTKLDHMFRSAIGRRIERVNFARNLWLTKPRMEVSIIVERGHFVISDCSPITNAEADAIRGRAIESIIVEINDDEKAHWLPARLSITVGGGDTIELTAHVPIYYMDEDTRMFERFPVPINFMDDRSGFHNPFGDLPR
jgi:hypothetical protein